MSAKEQQPNMGGYASELDKLVRDTTATINSIISSAFNEVIGKYLTTEESRVREGVSSLGDITKQEQGRYLNFVVKSGKIYEYAFGIVLKNIIYAPRTLEDLLTRPTDLTADRETRNAARYTSLLLYGMLPNAIQAMYAKESLSSISKTILESLEKEFIYLEQYLKETGAKDEEVKNIVQLVDSLIKVPAVVGTQMYSTLSKIFTPEITSSILASPSVVGTTKELYRKFYDNVVKILGTESKKEVVEVAKPEKEGVKEQEKVESKKETTEVAEQEKKNIKEQEVPKQEKEDEEKDDIEVEVVEKGPEN